jgi:septal ring factor EnvC (AmiA/AmiB activator)
VDYGKQILSLTRTVQEHEAVLNQMQQDVREIRREMQVLSEALQRLRLEQQHDREMAAKEREMAAKDRENLLLRLENYVLRAERRLPPPGSSGSEVAETRDRWSACQPIKSVGGC